MAKWACRKRLNPFPLAHVNASVLFFRHGVSFRVDIAIPNRFKWMRVGKVQRFLEGEPIHNFKWFSHLVCAFRLGRPLKFILPHPRWQMLHRVSRRMGFLTAYDPATEDQPQFQAYIGYAWTRFTGIPNNALNLNGFSATFTGFVHGIGIEGELGGELGSFAGETAKLSFLGIGAISGLIPLSSKAT